MPLQEAPIADLKPHTRALLAHLGTLCAVLAIVPRQVVLQVGGWGGGSWWAMRRASGHGHGDRDGAEAGSKRAGTPTDPHPAPLPWRPQDNHGQPQPALGTHRMWAAEAVALLLLPGQSTIDAALAASGLVVKLVALALTLDKANVLHTRVMRMLGCSLRSSTQELWGGLFASEAGRTGNISLHLANY